MVHISFDDVYECIWQLEMTKPASIFDNYFFFRLKQWREEYGAVFTLNCFNYSSVEPEYSINQFPKKYGKELRENADWLKFSFHARDDFSNYGDGRLGSSTSGNVTGDCVERIAADYEFFAESILGVAEEEKVIDHVVRLGFFSGTQENIRALQKGPHGICGLLSADDNRLSYYLTRAQAMSLQANNQIIEQNLQLPIIASQKRLEDITDKKEFCIHLDNLLRKMPSGEERIELFTHEYVFISVEELLEYLFLWVRRNKLKYGFPEQEFLKNKKKI